MAFSLSNLRAEILSYLDVTVFPGQNLYKQSVEDVTIMETDSAGVVKPYISYSIGDIQQWGAKGFTGPRGDDYVVPLYLKIVVPGSEEGNNIGEQLYDRCIDLFLGHKFTGSGNIRKRAGGSQFPLKKADGATEALVFPASFGIVTQLRTTT